MYLQDSLVPSHLPTNNNNKTWLHRALKGTYKCGFCNHCANVNECKQFSDFKAHKAVYCLSGTCGCYAIKKVHLDYPMTKHFYKVRNSNPYSLMVEGLDTIKKNI